MNLTLTDLRTLMSVEISDAEKLKGQKVTGISTDSRTVQKGDIFFALKGERFDGHQFVPEVISRGAVAVVVDTSWRRNAGEATQKLNACVVAVQDTTKAFGELAGIYRRKFSIPVIALGGSNGKTTTKEMIAAVLKSKFTVLSTEGNRNNHIGVPQMLFRLTAKHDIAVLEFGTNHFGEIKYLCDIAAPTHALITNIAKEHLEFFGDEEGVAREETELFDYVATKGFAFINIDDGRLVKAGRRVRHSMRYGRGSAAHVRAAAVCLDELGRPRFELRLRGKKGGNAVQLSVAGEHNVSNALAAVTVGLRFRVPEKKVLTALQRWSAVEKRLETISRNGITILNDTYNANPDSVLAALKAFSSLKSAGKKIVVLGDMLELGEKSDHEHAKIGLAVSDLGFEYLMTVGPSSRFTHEASKLAFAEHFETKEALVKSLKGQLTPGDAVLVKGSRGMKMEEVVAQL